MPLESQVHSKDSGLENDFKPTEAAKEIGPGEDKSLMARAKANH